MGFQITKRIKIAPGVQVTVSQNGAGLAIGIPGLKIHQGPKGTRLTVGLPGTGIRYTTRIGKKPN